jgi:hypothetical protein
MRVTKIIREYVEKTIVAKIPYGEPIETYNQHKVCLNDLTKQLNKKISQYADELIAGVGNLPEGFHITKGCYNQLTCSSYGSPMQKAAEQHESEIRNKRQEAIENILLELELGATKADLERLIAEAIGE